MSPLTKAASVIALASTLCTVAFVTGLPNQVVRHPTELLGQVSESSGNATSNTGPSALLRAIAPAIAVGVGSSEMIFDSATNTTYVMNTGSETISVITGTTTFSLSGTLSVGVYPSSLLVDDQDHQLLIGSYNPMGPGNAPLNGTITVYSTTTDALVGSVQIGGIPFSMAFSPHTDELFVAKYYSGNVSVLSVNPFRVLTTINVTTSYGLLYDQFDGLVYDGSGELNGSVLAIDPMTNTIVSTIRLGSTPENLLLNPWNRLLYVPCGVYYSNYYPSVENATYVVNTSAAVPVAIAPLPAQPGLVALDSTNGDVIVGSSRFTNERQFFDGNLTVISGRDNTVSANIPVSAYFYGLVSDNVTGALYLLTSGNLTVFNATTVSPLYTVELHEYPNLLAVSPSWGALFIVNPSWETGVPGEVGVYQAPLPVTVTTATEGGSFPLVLIVVSASIGAGAVVASIYAVLRWRRNP